MPAATITNSRGFSVADRGGVTVSTAGRSSSMAIGHARVIANAGSAAPAGLAIFTLRQNNNTVSDAAVPATVPVQAGRFAVEIGPSVNTGVAISNPNDQPTTVSFFFTNAAGSNFSGGNVTLPPNSQVAAFLDQAPFHSPQPFQTPITSARTFTLAPVLPSLSHLFVEPQMRDLSF